MKKDQTDLIDELLKFPRGLHDDLIDALSYMLEIAVGGADRAKAKVYLPSHLQRKRLFSFNRR
jgi:phage terminase large subunit-like protein